MEEKKGIFTIVNEEGQEVECEILFTFDCEDTLKSYIGYTDHSIASNGRKNIYVSAFDPLKPIMELEDVTDPREMEMIADVLEQIDKNVANDNIKTEE